MHPTFLDGFRVTRGIHDHTNIKDVIEQNWTLKTFFASVAFDISSSKTAGRIGKALS